jgi:ABC-2 type transport system ATP-binding protein
MTASPAIEVESLVKRFGDVAAVDGISFSVPAGTTAALLGGNGAGKTTTIGMILGLVRPTSGRIHVLGHDIAIPNERHKVLARMNFESPFVDLPKRLSVQQNLEIYARLYSIPNFKARIAALAEELQLGELLKRPSGQLSAGQKTRVGLAKALLNSPEVLFLDEPTASLDPDTGDWVRGLLERYKNEHRITTLLASHNMDEVERLVDEVFMMSRGKIVARGTPKALIERFGRANMEEVFLDVARGRELKFEPEAAE